MQEFFTLIANFGFPIVVAGYLLFRFENKIDKLTETIIQNNTATTKLATEVKGLKTEVRRIKK